MRASITGADGKVRTVRAVRCKMAAIIKRAASGIIAAQGDEGRNFLRRCRNINRRAKNAPGRYARRAARLTADAEHAI